MAGAELATAPEAAERLEEGVSKVTPAMVERLEGDIDRYMERVSLPPKFVIPGGTELSARLDVARAAVRRRSGAQGERAASWPTTPCSPTSTGPPTRSTRWPGSPTRTSPELFKGRG